MPVREHEAHHLTVSPTFDPLARAQRFSIYESLAPHIVLVDVVQDVISGSTFTHSHIILTTDLKLRS